MKRYWLILCASFALSGSAFAQGLSTIFSQKSSDLKDLEKQIALLQLYIGDIEKGYRIAQEGLDFIGNMKKGEFDLHQAFFHSLKTVNPTIDKYSKIAAIISYQVAIMSDFKKAIEQVARSGRFNNAEMSYINAVYSGLTAECSKGLEDLIAVISNDVLEMSDDERIRRIDGIYSGMRDKYVFTESFTGSASVVDAMRLETINNPEFLKTIE